MECLFSIRQAQKCILDPTVSLRLNQRKMKLGIVCTTEVLYIKYHYHMSMHLKVHSQCKFKLMTRAK